MPLKKWTIFMIYGHWCSCFCFQESSSQKVVSLRRWFLEPMLMLMLMLLLQLNELIVGHDAARNSNGFWGELWTLLFLCQHLRARPFSRCQTQSQSQSQTQSQKLATRVKLTPSLLLWARDNCAHGREPCLPTHPAAGTLQCRGGGRGCKGLGLEATGQHRYIGGRGQSAETNSFNCSSERQVEILIVFRIMMEIVLTVTLGCSFPLVLAKLVSVKISTQMPPLVRRPTSRHPLTTDCTVVSGVGNA